MCASPRSAVLRLRRCAVVHGSTNGSADFALVRSPVSPGSNGALDYAGAPGKAFNLLRAMSSGHQSCQQTSLPLPERRWHDLA